MISRFITIASVLATLGYSAVAAAQVIPKSDVYVVDQGTTVYGGTVSGTHAYCSDSTDQVIGGGCWNANFGQKTDITQSFPEPWGNTSSTDAFYCEWQNPFYGPLVSYARAMCVSQ